MDKRLSLFEGQVAGLLNIAIAKTVGEQQLIAILAALVAPGTGFHTAEPMSL